MVLQLPVLLAGCDRQQLRATEYADSKAAVETSKSAEWDSVRLARTKATTSRTSVLSGVPEKDRPKARDTNLTRLRSRH
jgi:hypothetical protein